MSIRQTIEHLLPRSKPWNLVYDRLFVRLVDGMAPTLNTARTFFDEAWLDLFPRTTRSLDGWERQWALPQGSLTDQERRDRLAGVWRAIGGNSPGYITRTLQGAGFPVYVHEYWDLNAVGYPVPKDPRLYLLPEHGGTDTDGYLIANRIRTSQIVDPIGCGEAWAACGEPRALCGYYADHAITYSTAIYVGGPERHPYYLYIGGETFPDTVDIPADRRDEFETLCLKICPAQQWLVLRVRYI